MADFREYKSTFNEHIDDIKHYGVIGMKWGIRRYQPYPKGKSGKEIGDARQITRKLEGFSKQGARNDRAMNIARQKMNTSRKGSERYEIFKKHFEEAKKSKEYSQKEINNILKKIDKKKMDVSKTNILTYKYTPGEHAAGSLAWFFGGPLAWLAVNTINMPGAEVGRTKYKVKNKK